jgi:hypothetical protein
MQGEITAVGTFGRTISSIDDQKANKFKGSHRRKRQQMIYPSEGKIAVDKVPKRSPKTALQKIINPVGKIFTIYSRQVSWADRSSSS